jgi:hypothetical protein
VARARTACPSPTGFPSAFARRAMTYSLVDMARGYHRWRSSHPGTAPIGQAGTSSATHSTWWVIGKQSKARRPANR